MLLPDQFLSRAILDQPYHLAPHLLVVGTINVSHVCHRKIQEMLEFLLDAILIYNHPLI